MRPLRLSLPRARALTLAAVVGGAGLLGACGDDKSYGATEVKALPDDAVPAEMLGLEVEEEKAAEAVASQKRPFIDAVGLYSMRDDDLLMATLQVSRFSEDADATDSQFRRAVVQGIGSTAPKPFRMADQEIFLTTGRRQSVAIWFKDRTMFVLSTRDDYDTPRTLLREALEIEPGEGT